MGQYILHHEDTDRIKQRLRSAYTILEGWPSSMTEQAIIEALAKTARQAQSKAEVYDYQARRARRHLAFWEQ